MSCIRPSEELEIFYFGFWQVWGHKRPSSGTGAACRRPALSRVGSKGAERSPCAQRRAVKMQVQAHSFPCDPRCVFAACTCGRRGGEDSPACLQGGRALGPRPDSSAWCMSSDRSEAGCALMPPCPREGRPQPPPGHGSRLLGNCCWFCLARGFISRPWLLLTMSCCCLFPSSPDVRA